VVSYDFVNGSYARAKMSVKDYSADGYCVEIWYDWVLRQPPGGHLHDDATGLRVCGVGQKRLWPTNGQWEYDDNPSVIDAATGIRITLCLWASGRQHRDSCTSWYPPDSRIPYQP